MKIIITKTRKLATKEDIEALEAELANIQESTDPENEPNPLETECLVYRYCDDVKVGYDKILIKAEGAEEFTFAANRREIAGMAIDGEPVVLRGNDFHRIGCITTQEDLTEKVDSIMQKVNAKKADLDADAQRKIAVLNAEYADYQTRHPAVVEDAE